MNFFAFITKSYKNSDGVIYRAETVLRKKKVKEDQMQYRAKQKRELVESKRRHNINPDFQDKIKRAEKFIMEKRATQKNFVNQKKRKFKELDQDIDGKIILAIRLRGYFHIDLKKKFEKFDRKAESMLEIVEVEID